jgi:hypothetical protein
LTDPGKLIVVLKHFLILVPGPLRRMHFLEAYYYGSKYSADARVQKGKGKGV